MSQLDRQAIAGRLRQLETQLAELRAELEPEAQHSGLLSPAGVEFIARFEGFRSRLYNDAAGHCTIGYGHLVHRGPCDGSEPAEFKGGITPEIGRDLLAKDAFVAADAVGRLIDVPFTQPQFDALVSFTFNVGAGALERSTLRRKLNAGDYEAVPRELMRWTRAGGQVLEGLRRRREAEGLLFASGDYGA